MEAPVSLPYSRFAALRGDSAIPPLFEHLWSAGTLEGLGRPCIAIVGTRAATSYGKALARVFAAGFAAAGCCVISGLALGIDAAAHEGALEARGITVGVLGSGHEQFFPQRNRKLAQAMIAAGGAVLSPFAPGERAYPSHFLQRNGIVAALADALVVIEAPARSGALNTAGWAAGRIPVFAVPGDVDRAQTAGCHALIRDGAILARSAKDVLDDLRLSGLSEPDNACRREEPGDPLQARLLTLLRGSEAGLEDLIARSNEPASRVVAALSLLDLEGFIETRPGQRYCLR